MRVRVENGIMHHKLLLGSTALVGASLLLATTAAAQEFEVSLQGYTEFGLTGATEDTFFNSPESNRSYGFFMDTEIHILADGEANGVLYGSYVELEVYKDTYQGGSDTGADEANLYFSGGFGRIELGRNDGAEDLMFVGAEDAQAGTGGLDGDTRNLGIIQIFDSDDAAKATYFTPRIAGFQLGVSYVPDTGDNAAARNGQGNVTDTNEFDIEEFFGGGVNWTGAFGAVDMILSAVGSWGDGESDTVDDVKDWSVGGRLGVGGLQFGVGYGSRNVTIVGGDNFDAEFGSIGLKYGFGPANVSVGFERDWFDDLDDNNIFVVSGDIGILPGVVMKADVSYATDDPDGDQTDTGPESDDTLSGVLTVQVSY
jgi:outer membrane protein OmpU